MKQRRETGTGVRAMHIMMALFLCLLVFTGKNEKPVTVIAASAVRLNQTKLELNIGEKQILSVKGTKKKIRWTTSNHMVATVSKKGAVKAKKEGSATIRAKVGKKTLTCKVKVKALPEMELEGKKVRIGQTASELKEMFGEPDRIDKTIYSFDYYVYHTNDYQYFFMAGVQKDKIVAFYTDCSDFYIEGLTPRTTKSDIRKLFGETVEPGTEEALFTSFGYQYTMYFDTLGGGQLVGVLVKAKNTSNQKRTSTILRAEEKEIFDCCNSARVRHGLKPLLWSEEAAKAARCHSEDMAARKYFDHYSPDGTSVMSRMIQQGISFIALGENIIAGYEDAVSANNGWLNSSGHRSNMLEEIFTSLGVGGSVGTVYHTYYTEDFFD